MSKFVHVAAVSYSTYGDYQNPPSLRKTILRETAERLSSLSGLGLDLVVIPEATGYYAHDPQVPESIEKFGPLMQLYHDFSRREKCFVAGSVLLYTDGVPYNSLVFFDDEGKVLGSYRKNFLTFGPGSEVEMGIRSGDGIKYFDTRIGRLGGLVCFDLNFAELRMAYREARPDILCFSSMFHGGLMQSVWAYELRSFFIAALSSSNANYGILDPFGREVRFASSYVPNPTARINLDRVMMHLTWNQEKFTDIRRKYGEDVTLDIPPSIGSALLYSNSAERSAVEIAREFDLVLLDDFFNEARLANAKNRK